MESRHTVFPTQVKWKSLGPVLPFVTPLEFSRPKLGSYSLLQGIFPTQGSNPGLPHCRQILYQLSHKGSLRILEWVAIPFFRGSSPPRGWPQVSHIVGRIFTFWATREAPVQETCVWSLVWEDPLEKEMATHTRILAWEIPWTEEPGRL